MGYRVTLLCGDRVIFPKNLSPLVLITGFGRWVLNRFGSRARAAFLHHFTDTEVAPRNVFPWIAVGMCNVPADVPLDTASV